MTDSNRVSTPKLILGLAVIAAGVLFTLDNLRIVDADDFILYWPVALIAIGVAQLPRASRQQAFFGWVLIGGGLWILLYNVEIVDLEPWAFFWPAILVLIGINLILGALRRRDAVTGAESVVNGFAFWSGLERQFSSQDFRGGDLTAIMGGCEIDLTGAAIRGEPPVLHVFAFWGGIDLRVPREWRIDFRVLPLLGGATDETVAPSSPNAPTLVVKGMAIMGGVEIKN